MEPKNTEHSLAVSLRRKGLSYTEIKEKVPVSQASLSLWLRDVELTKKQKRRLFLKGREAGGEARRQQRIARLKKLSLDVGQEIPHLIENPFFTLGLALYWAEGSKQKPWNPTQRVQFSNSDPRTVILMRQWLVKFFNIPHERFGYRLYIHKNSNTERSVRIWAKKLNIKIGNIPITYKNHTVRTNRRNVRDNYIGLIAMHVCQSTWMNRRIELWVNSAVKQIRHG